MGQLARRTLEPFAEAQQLGGAGSLGRTPGLRCVGSGRPARRQGRSGRPRRAWRRLRASGCGRGWLGALDGLVDDPAPTGDRMALGWRLLDDWLLAAIGRLVSAHPAARASPL